MQIRVFWMNLIFPMATMYEGLLRIKQLTKSNSVFIAYFLEDVIEMEQEIIFGLSQ